MFAPLVDRAGLVYLALGIAALVVGPLWWTNRKRPYLFALAGVGVLAVLFWLLTRVVVTDRMLIVRNVDVMAQAIHRRNLDEFFKHVSPSFSHAGMNPQEFRRYMETQLKRYGVRNFDVSKVVAEDVSRQAGTGKAEFWIYVEGNWEGEVPPLRCEAVFVREQDDWRLKGFKLFLGNTGNEFPLPPAH